MRALLFGLLLSCAPTAKASFDHRPIMRQVEAEFASGDKLKIAHRADLVLESMVRTGTGALREHGLGARADRWQRDYDERFAHTFEMSLYGAIGDHRPLSEWLEAFYQELVRVLGLEVVELLHLDDIWIFNFCLPVAFGWEDFLQEHIDEPEYAEHFIPFAGLCARWGVWAGCTAATWGSGAVTFICSPVAEIARKVTVKYIAPPLAPKVYDIFW